MRGRKGPLFSLIIPHDAACSWCSRKCWSASCPGTGMFSPSSQPGTFAGSSLLAGCGGSSGTPLAPSWNGCVAVPAVHSSVPSAPERAAATNRQHPENSSARRYACLTWSYKCCLSLELKNNFFLWDGDICSGSTWGCAPKPFWACSYGEIALNREEAVEGIASISKWSESSEAAGREVHAAANLV